MKTSCSDSCLSSAVSGAILSDEHVVRLRDCQAPLLLLLRLCVARCPERGAPCQEPCGGGACASVTPHGVLPAWRDPRSRRIVCLFHVPSRSCRALPCLSLERFNVLTDSRITGHTLPMCDIAFFFQDKLKYAILTRRSYRVSVSISVAGGEMT